ncbi:hypothetical protein [Enterococcus sp. AZ194]|uniref:hypothetical protein n=1 Tax=Enterococcus sp. AZ194 TaxID=2774629 RepID=UPI003F6821FD
MTIRTQGAVAIKKSGLKETVSILLMRTTDNWIPNIFMDRIYDLPTKQAAYPVFLST